MELVTNTCGVGSMSAKQCFPAICRQDCKVVNKHAIFATMEGSSATISLNVINPHATLLVVLRLPCNSKLNKVYSKFSVLCSADVL